MVKDIPLFPLNLVVFPGEELSLHIFEPRYKQLINDCLLTKTTFGIPSYVETRIEYGTEVKIVEVSRLYEDGRMDIKTAGLRVFKVLDFQNPWDTKQYAGGPVELVEGIDDADSAKALKITELCKELFAWLHMEEEISLGESAVMYDVIHKIGMKPEEEYQLLKMKSESERQSYVINHLEHLIPALERAEKAKEKIRMNGHFKHFDPLKF
ncbi:MAG: LON peptidase substrate-binding domain-containing protein [Marinoscillum sp.]|uniref:LON peptidase substrate-binding domain-containing protein n=1 Tax=Marinoscillum sp. TaxID=2024838 RepID=UPI0032FDC896